MYNYWKEIRVKSVQSVVRKTFKYEAMTEKRMYILTLFNIIVLFLVSSQCLSHLIRNEIHKVRRMYACKLNDIF